MLNLLHGQTQRPQHLLSSVKVFSASFMSLLIWSMPSSMRSSCSKSKLWKWHFVLYSQCQWEDTIIMEQQTLTVNPPVIHPSDCISARKYYILSNMKTIFHKLILRHLASYCGKICSKEICIIGACEGLFRDHPCNRIKCISTRLYPQHFSLRVSSELEGYHKSNQI